MNISRLELGNKPLYFLHIPKTAGTTFISALHAWFPADKVCPAYLWRDLLEISREALATYRLFRGHFYDYIYRVLPIRPIYITSLRNPVQRSLSHYEHVRREPGHYFHQRTLSQDGLVDFLRDPETRTMIKDFQTRSLALDLDPVQIAATLNQQQTNDLTLERILESTLPNKISNQALLDLPETRLEQFAFVGIVERFKESVEAFSRMLETEPSAALHALNISPERELRQYISQDMLELILENTQIDAELYEYGRTLFAAQLGQMTVSCTD